ncbi:hypothetical protein NHP190012_00360 [Helicobacter sp. NHP19-012]|uniref:Lipoprotein n=1 Tax=Helicobacter gastrofelis TaxID=2849642 RepID=A0ABM7SEH4_9HELI|nr:penicillin-binding protein activator LpoB [Helicobacter sp. NHP19-012]BCZ18394.1 hypothetical protein NHP190012_00360 [Helicobacter sp. NHP19-012]
MGCNDAPTQTISKSTGLAADIVNTARRALASMLESPKIQQLQGAVFGVLDVANNTKQRLDTEQLTEILLKTLEESAHGKFFATRAFADNSADHTIGKARELQTPQPSSKKPTLFLDTSIIQRTNDQHTTNYILALRVVKISTGLEVWSGEFLTK